MTTASTSLRLADIFALCKIKDSNVKYTGSRFILTSDDRKICYDCALIHRNRFKLSQWVAVDIITNFYHRALRCSCCAKHIPAAQTHRRNGGPRVKLT